MKQLLTAMAISTLTAGVEAFGLYFIRLGGFDSLLKASAIFAAGVVPLLRYAVSFEGIGMVNFLWNVVSTLLGFAIGIFLFKEKIKNTQIIGVVVSLLGLGILMMSPEETQS